MNPDDLRKLNEEIARARGMPTHTTKGVVGIDVTHDFTSDPWTMELLREVLEKGNITFWSEVEFQFDPDGQDEPLVFVGERVYGDPELNYLKIDPGTAVAKAWLEIVGKEKGDG